MKNFNLNPSTAVERIPTVDWNISKGNPFLEFVLELHTCEDLDQCRNVIELIDTNPSNRSIFYKLYLYLAPSRSMERLWCAGGWYEKETGKFMCGFKKDFLNHRGFDREYGTFLKGRHWKRTLWSIPNEEFFVVGNSLLREVCKDEE